MLKTFLKCLQSRIWGFLSKHNVCFRIWSWPYFVMLDCEVWSWISICGFPKLDGICMPWPSHTNCLERIVTPLQHYALHFMRICPFDSEVGSPCQLALKANASLESATSRFESEFSLPQSQTWCSKRCSLSVRDAIWRCRCWCSAFSCAASVSWLWTSALRALTLRDTSFFLLNSPPSSSIALSAFCTSFLTCKSAFHCIPVVANFVLYGGINWNLVPLFHAHIHTTQISHRAFGSILLPGILQWRQIEGYNTARVRFSMIFQQRHLFQFLPLRTWAHLGDELMLVLQVSRLPLNLSSQRALLLNSTLQLL